MRNGERRCSGSSLSPSAVSMASRQILTHHPPHVLDHRFPQNEPPPSNLDHFTSPSLTPHSPPKIILPPSQNNDPAHATNVQYPSTALPPHSIIALPIHLTLDLQHPIHEPLGTAKASNQRHTSNTQDTARMSQVPIATSTLSFPAHRTRWRAGAVARSRSLRCPFSEKER